MNLLTLFIMSLSINSTINVQSFSFAPNGYIPAKYTCQGDNVNPPLTIDGIPSGTKSLAIIMDDPDAPKGTFVHWLVWNITPTSNIAENSSPGVKGSNGRKDSNYTGPCPPSGTHHYHFKVYALDAFLDLEAGSQKIELEQAMAGHIIASGELIGLYKKS